MVGRKTKGTAKKGIRLATFLFYYLVDNTKWRPLCRGWMEIIPSLFNLNKPESYIKKEIIMEKIRID